MHNLNADPGPVKTTVTTEKPNNNIESDGSNSAGMITGITISVTVLLIAIVVIFLYLCVRRKRRLNKMAL